MDAAFTLSLDAHGVAELGMEDRQGRNAFSPPFLAGLAGALEEVRTQAPAVLILKGLPEVFLSGASAQTLLDIHEGRTTVEEVDLPDRLLGLPFPVIAAMEGPAVGGGLVATLCCDLLLAARESRYGVPFLAYGLTPGMGCTTLLAELVGPFLAAEMMFTGRYCLGSELEERGARFNRVLPRSEVLPAARDLARRMAGQDHRLLALLHGTLVQHKQRLLLEARNPETLMHRLCLGGEAARQRILEAFPP